MSALRIPIELLRCPATGEALTAAGDDALVNEAGSSRYPVVDGAPVLIDDSRSLFTAAQVAGSRAPAPATRRLRPARLLPSPGINPGAEERFARFAELVAQETGERRARVLVVGGGELGRGMEALASDPRIELIETDVYLGSRVVVACDAHHLPFADGVFDAVIVQAVLEHVLDPQLVVSEIHRVLRDEGIVSAETPFMQQVHEGAFDFTRFTDLGHRALFSHFDEIERGVACGPGMGLLWSLRYLARSLPRRSLTAARVLDRLATLLFFWLKYLDLRLASHPGARDAASSVYFLGRKSQTAADAGDIIRGYVGTLRSAAAGRGL